MLLGAMSQLFRGPPADVAGAFVRHRLSCVQLTPGFPSLRFHQPGDFTPDRCRQAADPFRQAGIAVACLTGPAGLLDSDLDRRHRGVLRWHALIRHCRDFGTHRVVTETGNRGPDSRSADHWAEFRSILAEGLRVASDHDVLLLLKPGPGHVLGSVDDALRLRIELDHPNLGFVLDPAGFLAQTPPEEWPEAVDRLVAQIGPWCPVVHAKDLRVENGTVGLPRVGQGVLDYGQVLRLLRPYQSNPAVILEHLRPGELAEAKRCLEEAVLQAT